MTPKLKKIDLNKREGCQHPDILSYKHKQYLAYIDKDWCAGTFTLQWYGWNFRRNYDATCGVQLDDSGFKELYEIN
jgi:hypothetical protein